ncbi:MAG: hypothetical protein M3Y33_07595 [Actinomycetota bacterium]|nr:hypothetical protein [Actinomycetota bacterium]
MASCIANNMLNEMAGHCPDGDTGTVGYARWYHASDGRPLPLLEQARRLLAAGGPLASVEQNAGQVLPGHRPAQPRSRPPFLRHHVHLFRDGRGR